jgi:hypothetical protein
MSSRREGGHCATHQRNHQDGCLDCSFAREDALQLRLNAADERIDLLATALSRIQFRCQSFVESDWAMAIESVEAVLSIAEAVLKPAEGGGMSNQVAALYVEPEGHYIGVPRDSVALLVEFLADARAYHKVVIERCNACIKSGESSEREEYGRIGYRTEKIEKVERLAEELRALLDAPACKACNDTGKMHEPGQEPGECSACFKEPAAQHQGEPMALPERSFVGDIRNPYRHTVLHDGYISGWNAYQDAMVKLGPLYAKQPAQVAVDVLSTGFYTTESGGGKYAINIGFRSMADMQAADAQLRELLKSR